MTSKMLTNSRAALIAHMVSLLSGRGFQQIEEVFEADRIFRKPGARVIINGQVFHQPGPEIPVKLRVELHGTGEVISPDGRREPFELMTFSMHCNGHSVGETTNVYYGCHEEFNKHLITYFNKAL